MWILRFWCLLGVAGALWTHAFSQESATITIPPQIMTYEQLAEILTTETRTVRADSSLKGRGILIHLKNRSWDEARHLLEHGLELEIREYHDDQGNPYWLIRRDPNAQKRDAHLFDQYVRVVTDYIQQDLQRYDPLITQSLEALREAYSRGGDSDEDENTPNLFRDFDERMPLPSKWWENTYRWYRLYWAQSLDGYVMLRWMRPRWDEHLTRRLIRERGLIMLQPRALGVGELDEETATTFLRGLEFPEEAYDLAMGVIGWDASTRRVVPYADLLAPVDAGTGWLFTPVHIQTEPIGLDSLFQQMGPSASQYFEERTERQYEGLQENPYLYKAFQCKHAHTLSEIVQAYATQLHQEVLMELAPEREWGHRAHNLPQLTLAMLADPASLFLSDSDSYTYEPTSYWWGFELLMHHAQYFDTLTEPASFYDMFSKVLAKDVGTWRYEYYQGVLIAHNLMAFLDRVYNYPFPELVRLERALKVGSDGSPVVPIEARWRFVQEIARTRTTLASVPAMQSYRAIRLLDIDFTMLPVLASLERFVRQKSACERLQRGETVSIRFSQLGRESAERIVQFWRLNTFYQMGHQPFGYRYAWHPDLWFYLNRGRILLEPNNGRIEVSLRYPLWDSELEEWHEKKIALGMLS